MMGELLEGQYLANDFLRLLPPTEKEHSNLGTQAKAGQVVELPIELQLELAEIFLPGMSTGSVYHRLFGGDTSDYGGDHSAADMALVGYMARQGLSPEDVDKVFRASKLYRPKWDEMRGPLTYGERTISKAFKKLPAKTEGGHIAAQEAKIWKASDPSSYRPVYVPGGMPARKFVGPVVSSGVRLFPAAALSTLVALGAVGKTSLLVSIALHTAAGKDWNGHRLVQNKVAVFSCEETEEELSRKVSAIIDEWTPPERQAALDNTRLVPLLGVDARLTLIERNQYQGSGVAEEMIALLNAFGLKDGLVILDHMQGFASGDLNISETATSICREANKIVEATGAAVVFAAHISKANIKATELEQGFAVGSLAFENATRQMVGMLPMREEDAKKYGLEGVRNQYAWLGLPKNSYGGTDGGVWLKKELVPKYHTVTVTPVQLTAPVSGGIKTANEKIADRILDYLAKHPWTTRNQLDSEAGLDGRFNASKEKVRAVLKGMLDSGRVETQPVADADRSLHGVPKQVKGILRVKSAAKAAEPLIAEGEKTG
jgi:hypothetical protein